MKSIILPGIIIVIVLLIGGLIMWNKKVNTPIESIKKLSFGYTTGTAYLANVQYDIQCKDKCIVTIKLEGMEEEAAKEVWMDEKNIQELINFLNENKVYKWDGFQKSDLNVLDGNSFHFFLQEQNGRNIDASGYMKYPSNYREVRDYLDQLFKSM